MTDAIAGSANQARARTQRTLISTRLFSGSETPSASGDQRLALASAGHLYPVGSNAALDEFVVHALRALARQLVVELGVAHRVRMTDDKDIRIGSGGNIGKNTLHFALRFGREFVIATFFQPCSEQGLADEACPITTQELLLRRKFCGVRVSHNGQSYPRCSPPPRARGRPRRELEIAAATSAHPP